VSITGEATWFRSGGRSLEGWVHRPEDGRAVGAILIAGELAWERMVTYRALRVLAITAAQRGWVVVRFSWTGVGDSGPLEPGSDLVELWRQDLAAAVELARAVSGISDVDAIGLRVGASMLAAAADVPLRTRLLWEPIGGRAFIRKQSILLGVDLPDDFARSPNGAELCGTWLDDAQAASLRSLADATGLDVGSLPAGATVVLEEDRTTAQQLYESHPWWAKVPLESENALLDRLTAAEPFGLPAWEPELVSVIDDPESGVAVRRTLVDIGPHHFPGILAERAEAPRADAAVLLLPGGNELRNAISVHERSARWLAARGVPNLRADRRSTGDGMSEDRLRESRNDSEASVEDVAELAAFLSQEARTPVTVMGTCAGGWLGARAAALPGTVQRLIMVNNWEWGVSVERQDRLASERVEDEPDPGEQQSAPDRLAFVHSGGQASYRLPYWFGYFVRKWFAIGDHAELLLRGIPSTTPLAIYLCESDWKWFVQARGQRALRRMISRGKNMRIEVDPRLDHSLMSRASSDAYIEILEREFADVAQSLPQPAAQDGDKP
jgi:alpha-beta hydrolase superfamily lysophospholipase